MLRKLKELLEEKGQGIVEYALILGFVAIIAIFILNGSHLKENVDQNIKNANTVASTMTAAFAASNPQAAAGGSVTP